MYIAPLCEQVNTGPADAQRRGYLEVLLLL